MSSYTEGQIHQLANALEGDGFIPDDVTKLGQYKELTSIRGVLRGTHEIKPIVNHDVNFQKWRTITLGRYKSASDYLSALGRAKISVSFCAKDILSKQKFTVSEIETEVDVAIVTVAKLGFKNGAQYGEICARAKELGLNLCPAEVGPSLRLAFEETVIEIWRHIAMEAVIDSGGYQYVFSLGSNGYDSWLSTRYGRPDLFWDSDSRFVFVLCK